MTIVYLFNVTEKTIIENSHFTSLLPDNRLNKPNLMPEIKYLTSIFGEIIVRVVAKNKLNINNGKILIEHEKSGKPYLKNFPDFHFNISHSDNTVAVAFSDSPVGIDIEKLSPVNFKVAKRFFSDIEVNYINNHINSQLAFYEIWTAKEAYFKRSGKGIDRDFRRISVTDSNISKNIKTFEKNGFVMSVCCNSTNEIIIKNFENLLEKT